MSQSLSDGRGDPRVTTRMPPRMLAQLDRLVATSHYSNRSEAIRAGLISLIEQEGEQDE